jgi:uncharacterized membrane protein required for colicin V production
MNWIDVALLVVALSAVVSGYQQGLSRAGLGFLGLVLALVCAAWQSPGNWVGFAIVFCLVVIVTGIAVGLLARSFKWVGLEWADHLLGGAFGLVNVALLWVVAVLAAMAFAPKLPQRYVARSCLAPYAIEAARDLADAAPPEMKVNIHRTYDDLQRLLPKRLRKPMPGLPATEI